MKLAIRLLSELNQRCGCIGCHPMSSKVAMDASIGLRTNFHLFRDLLSLANDLCQHFLSVERLSWLEIFHSCIQVDS